MKIFGDQSEQTKKFVNSEKAYSSICDGSKTCEKPIYRRKCECPVNESLSFSGSFSLACGSSLKIFESDEPAEIFMEIVLREPSLSIDLCGLTVKAELENGEILEFDIQNPNISTSSSDRSGIHFYTQKARKVTLECQSDIGIVCSGIWGYSAVLRGSKNGKCECPVNDIIGQSSNYALTCGKSVEIFRSDDPTEMFMSIELREISGQSSCDLKLKVDLANGDVFEFDIPGPISIAPFTDANDISFYSKKICRVTIECQSGADIGCQGFWSTAIILRGQQIESL